MTFIPRISFWSLRCNQQVCPVCDFLCAGLLADCLLIRLHGSVLQECETILTQYFIIHSKMNVLCYRNCLVVLTYPYIHPRTYNQLSTGVRKWQTHTPVSTFDLACANTHTSPGARLVSTSRIASNTYTDMSAVHELEVVDCTHGLAFLSSCDLF